MNDLKAKLQKEQQLITEYTKELENLALSIKDMQKEVKELKTQKKDVDDRIKASLAEVYALENAIKMGE